MAEEVELGYQPAKLPSRGVLYDGKIPDGVVQVRKFTGREEAMLLGTGAQGLQRMEITLRKCVRLPNEFIHEELLMTDRLACMLALRTITFGAAYSFSYKCQFCNGMQKANINILEDLDEKTPETIAFKMVEKGVQDWTLEEPVHCDLKDANKHVELRFLRGKDESRIVKRTKRMLMQSIDTSDPSYLYRFALQIITVDGEDWSVGKKEMFLAQLSATDIARMRIAVEDVEPGIDLRIYPECRNCGAVNEMPLPFTAEFFRPSSLHVGGL